MYTKSHRVQVLTAVAVNLGNYFHVLLMLSHWGHALHPSQPHIRSLSGMGCVPSPQRSHRLDQAKEKSGSLKHLLTIKHKVPWQCFRSNIFRC